MPAVQQMKTENCARIDALKMALAGGMLVGFHGFGITFAAVCGIPGYRPVAKALESGYGPYGYSVSKRGALVGAGYGFIEGFVRIGALGLLYNWLVGRKV